MSKSKTPDELLKTILEQASLNFLSDLHDSDYKLQVCGAVQLVPADDFDAQVWVVATAYILDEPVRSFSSAVEAKEFLVTKLRHNI